MKAMTYNEQLMFRLLRAALWSEPIDLKAFPAKADWLGVLRCACRQTVQGLVAHALGKVLDRIGTAATDRLQETCVDLTLHCYHDNELLNLVLAEVVGRLRQHGLDPILIKGQGIAQRYDEPSLRVCGDIDLYLGRAGVERAREVLRPLYADGDDSYPKHFSFTFRGADIELHRYVINADQSRTSRRMRAFAQRELSASRTRQTTIGPCTVTTPSVAFDTVFTFYHLWEHLMRSGIGLRQFCDLARCLHVHHDELDTVALEQLLREARLLRPWRVCGVLLVDHLGLPAAEMPLYRPGYRRSCRRLLQTVLRNGNFGKQQDERIVGDGSRGYLRQKVHSMAVYFSHWACIFPVDPHGVTLQACRYVAGGFHRLARRE